jgi:hypothetical protein
MKIPAAVLLALLCVGVVHAKEKEVPPFAADLQTPRDAEILLHTASNQVQYLGFNWINFYCFGRLGCAVSNQPATVSYTVHETVFSAGDWLIYATCTIQVWMLSPCGAPGEPARIGLRKNPRLLDVSHPPMPCRTGWGNRKCLTSIYEIHSAFNVRTRETWGQDSLDTWRMVVASLAISEELKGLSLDGQLAWARKISDLRTAGLINAANLEAVLAEMQGAAKK